MRLCSFWSLVHCLHLRDKVDKIR